MKKSILSLILVFFLLPLWANYSAALTEVEKATSYHSSVEDFSVLPPDCEDLFIDIATTQLSPCITSYIQVFYCNNSDELATGVVLEIDLDDIFDIQFSEEPATITGNHLLIEIGDIMPNTCKQFEISTKLSCDILPNQSYSNEATISSIDCLANDDISAPIALSSQLTCNGNGVTFNLKNNSNRTWNDLSAIIVQEDVILLEIEDDTFNITSQDIIVQEDVILLQGTFDSIPAQDSLVFSIDLVNTNFIQLQVKSGTASLDFPNWVEGCDNMGRSGFPTQYLTSENNPSHAREYRIVDLLTDNVGIFDSKTLSIPTGFSPRHFVSPNTPIEYTLYYFEEVSPQSSQSIEIINTLSPFMDETTVIPGASVRPTFFNQSGNTLSFTIDNPVVLEIDGRFYTDGLVKFQVQQNADIPAGTIINNSAMVNINGSTVTTLDYFHTIAEEVPTDYPKDNLIMDSKMPKHIGLCSEVDTVTLTIFNQNPFTMGSIEVHTFFPNDDIGLYIEDVIPHPEIAWINPPNLRTDYPLRTSPIFKINQISPNDSIQFSYLIKVDCELIDFAENNPIAITYDLTWNDDFVLFDQHLSTDNEQNTGIDIQMPNLVANIDHANYEGAVGDTFTRTISVTNTAAPYLIDDFFILHQPTEDFNVDAISLGILSATDAIGITGYEDYIAYQIDKNMMANVGDGDAYLEEGETLEITETITITGCEELHANYELLWTCAAEFDISTFCGQSFFEADIITAESPQSGTGDCINTSTKDVIAAPLQVYPNPSPGKINILLPFSTAISSLSIYNALGKKVKQMATSSLSNQQLQTLDLSDFEKGMYLLKIEVAEGYFFEKIMLE